MSVEMLRVSLAVTPSAQAIVGTCAREIVFLAARDESRADGAVGFGECAPLAGLHAETLDECLEALEEWSDGARDMEDLPPSAAFAASTACAALDGFGRKHVPSVAVAQLFAGSLTQCDDQALESLRHARVVKLKFGRASEADDRQVLTRLSAALPSARFRIDGNRALTINDCIARLHGCDAARVEYLEDPLRDPSQLAELSRRAGIAIALDETSNDCSREAQDLCRSLARDGCVVAWILRMSAIGSLEAIRARAARAVDHNADVVLSTAYESSYALRVAVHLAASLPRAQRAHGLGTAALLAEDSCAPALVRDGHIDGAPLPVPFAEAWS